MIKSVNEFYNKVCKLIVEMSTMEWEKIVVKIAKDAYDDVSDEIYDLLNELKDECHTYTTKSIFHVFWKSINKAGCDNRALSV